MKYLKALILFAMLITISQTKVYAQLSYAEGGPAVEDPGLEVAPELRRYVDSQSGNDANDGKTQATAWKTLSKVISEMGNIGPDFHVLFKRGQNWSGGLDYRNNQGGTDNHRIVFGAYGDLSILKPKFSGTVFTSSYFMVRDIQASKIAAVSKHHVIIYNNIVFGGGSNGIAITGASEHVSAVGNIVYDLIANTGIVLHAINWVTPTITVKSHFWILDNITIGNSEMEDPIAVAMGDFSLVGLPMEGDVKIIGNRVQTTSVPGLSTKTGSGRAGITLGHDGQYSWIVGNIVSGTTLPSIRVADRQLNVQISGNITFKGSTTSNTLEVFGPDIHCFNNTIYNYVNGTAPVILDSRGTYFNNNIVFRPEGGYWAQVKTNPIEMDYNWWGESTSPVINGISFSAWQTSTGFDLNSGIGPVSGITKPEDNAYNHDPRNWNDQTFLDQFIPTSDYKGNDGIIPGAFDKNGKRQGMAILPFEDSDLKNGGLGWEGPLIVQQRLKELGISWGEPLLAKYPSPKDKSINISLETDLSWETGDSTISHDVYFGTKADSLLFMGNQTGTTFNPGTLKYETVYYWRVDQVTVDSTVPGTLWSFTTKEEPIPPTLAENPNPGDGSVDQRTSLLLSWEPGKRTRSVKIYLGTVSPPPFVKNQEGNSYNVSGLELSTKYYWRIDGINEWGTTEGDVWEFTTQAVPTLPEGWVGLDIGKVGINGDDDLVDGQFVLTASGKGIDGNSDQFRYVYHSLSGNGEIVARIVSIENTSSSAIAGIMIRETLDSTSSHHMIGVTTEQGVRAKWRSFNKGATSIQAGSSVIAPYWLKLQRVSNYIVSSESADGQTWKTIKTEQIEMQSDVYMGLAVTSGTNNSLCTAVFDNVSINGVIVSVEDDQIESIVPKEFTIGNYPNPFNPTTTIKYDLPKHGNVKIQIYDIMGSLVEELVNGKQNAGSHSVIWNGKNSQGVQTASGIYLYKVQFNDQIKTAKMILMK